MLVPPMSGWLPSMVDIPMSLGGHLDELRRRLMWPVITLMVVFIGAFAVQGTLKEILVGPLRQAIALVPAEAKAVGLPLDPKAKLLTVFDLAESATTAATISFYLALALTAPVLLFQIWKFVSVGMTTQEKRLAFLFVPAGIICFYIGTVLGYFFAMPYFYAFLIQFAALDPTITITSLRQTEYVASFFLWTIAFGIMSCIPWLMVVIVRTGFVHPDQIARARKIVFVVCVIAASILTPGSDLASLVAMTLPLYGLFEIGLLTSRFFVPAKTAEVIPEESDDA